MRDLLRYFGQILLVGGAGIMLLAGTGSLLYADDHPAPAAAFVPDCGSCSPCTQTAGVCATSVNGTAVCTVAATTGACTASPGGLACACAKAFHTNCTCE